MSLIRNNFIKSLTGLALGFAALALFFIGGCNSDTTTNPPTYVTNPNVKSFDSVGVEEDSALSSLTSIVMINGTNTTGISADRDCSLASDTTDNNFYLRSGDLLKKLVGGFQSRYFRVAADMSASAFDTLSKVPGYDSLNSLDFTQDDTYGSGVWSYFNAPLTSQPVYCVWLKGRKDADPSSKNIFCIIQPREATDRNPGAIYGFRMSFRIRINTNGDNDFRKQILQQSK